MNGLIDVLIFSKDRAAQLDLLLQSINRYAAGIYRSITVLWAASKSEFKNAYGICADEHFGVDFNPEIIGTFEADVRDWIQRPWRSFAISFLVDDAIFYRDAVPPVLGDLPWSFRGGDYDYPFSLDGNVYAKRDVERLLTGLSFANPTELESQAHNHRARLPFSAVHHGQAPCLVGIPANRVSGSSQMPHMGVDKHGLNEQYLYGRRLLLPAITNDLPAHADLPLVFA